MSNTQTASVSIPPRTFSLATLTKSERNFLEFFYVQVYSPPIDGLAYIGNLWNPSMPTTFSRQLIRSICKKFGYAGTIHWIVRKQFGRRLLNRGVYDIPELLELHKLWNNTPELNLVITTNNGNKITINRKNNL